MSIKAYRKIQLGIETTAGTETDATVLWRGLGVPDDQLEFKWVDEDIGFVSAHDRSYISKLGGGLDMESTPVTFQQFPYILNSGVKTVTATTEATGSDYIWTYAFPTTSTNTIKTCTIEGGDDQQEEQMLYAFVKSFKVTGNPDEALMMSATWVGRSLAPGTFTSSVAIPTVQSALFNKGKLYIDEPAGTMGTTLKSNTLIGMDLTCDTGWTAVQTADGELYFSFLKHTREAMSLMCNITFEHDATAVAEKAAWRAQTGRQIRLSFTGNALTSVGTTYSNYTINFDLCGAWEKFDKIADKNGNDIVTGTFRAAYDNTAADFATITVVNETATL